MRTQRKADASRADVEKHGCAVVWLGAHSGLELHDEHGRALVQDASKEAGVMLHRQEDALGTVVQIYSLRIDASGVPWPL